MLLPYECVISNTNIRDCLAQYETSRRGSTDSISSPLSTSGMDMNQSDRVDQLRQNVPTADRVNCDTTPSVPVPQGKSVAEEGEVTDQNGHFGGFAESQGKPSPQLTSLLDHRSRDGGGGGMLARTEDGLMGFSEDSQGSLESMSSSQPLPDISVQDAESVLGIPTSTGNLSTQNSSSSSYPSYQGGREWPSDYTPNMDLPTGGGDMAMMGRPPYPSPHHMDMPGYPPYHPYSHRQDYPDYRQGMVYRPYPGVMGPGGHVSMDYSSPYQSGMMPGGMGMMRPRMDGPADIGYTVPPSHGPAVGDWHLYQRMRMAGPHQLQRMMYPQQHQHHIHAPPASSSPRPTPPPPPPQMMGPQIEYHHTTPRQMNRGADTMRNQWEEQRSGTSKHAPTTATKPELRGDVKQEKGGEGEGRTSTLSSGSEASTASKRPIPEWSGCVEGTKPQLVKRRRLNCDHCGECVCVCVRREAVCVCGGRLCVCMRREAVCVYVEGGCVCVCGGRLCVCMWISRLA